MGLLDFLVRAAVAAVAVWAIKETVSYFVTKAALKRELLEKKARGEFNEEAVAVMITHRDGHEVDFETIDRYGQKQGRGEFYSQAGIADDIRVGDVIVLE